MSREGSTSVGDSPTEGILDAARDLDQKSVPEVLALMHREDAEAHAKPPGFWARLAALQQSFLRRQSR